MSSIRTDKYLVTIGCIFFLLLIVSASFTLGVYKGHGLECWAEDYVVENGRGGYDFEYAHPFAPLPHVREGDEGLSSGSATSVASMLMTSSARIETTASPVPI